MTAKKICEFCLMETCPAKCFNEHEGSIIALEKLARQFKKETGKEVFIISDNVNMGKAQEDFADKDLSCAGCDGFAESLNNEGFCPECAEKMENDKL